ncbi:hypothetical protein Rhal01_03086 [Rubritalea halochordaticola]|uniref:Superoxide dismutase n=1 Tax=Rubritalea halochordaticola TaxID=714537 RepID=A0ABP9V2J8_9BACT
MMKKTVFALSSALLSVAAAPLASAHCQIPCGIYADDNVFVTMHKDQETIEKAMNQINELSKDAGKNANQLTRWVNNKEQHAQNIQDTVAKYFLAQRVKLDEAEKDAATYTKKLTLLHKITVLAMKCKQTTDLENAKKLHAALDEFQAVYAGKASAKAEVKPHTHADGTTHSH